MKRWQIFLGGLGLILVLASIWQIRAAQSGLEIIPVKGSIPPMTFILPAGMEPGSRPLVLIAHGFAGSGTMMRGFAFTLAHAGYATAVWDFDGHAANPRPLGSTSGDNLLADVEAVLKEAQQRGLAPQGKVAILGHSMGSGVAMDFGLSHPDTAATIAVSPTGADVSPQLPHNLLLMAGSLEGGFVQNADGLLAQAGGAGGDPKAGTARKLVVIPNVEHISIIFSPTTFATARAWLDGVFGPQPGATDYVDRRVPWFGVGILGALLAAFSFIPSPDGRGGKQTLTPESSEARSLTPNPSPMGGGDKKLWRRALAVIIAGPAAALALWLVGKAGLNMTDIFGISVGGFMLLWFGIGGAVGWLVLGKRLDLPRGKPLLCALLVFAALWLGVGLLGNFVWLPWLLIPKRLVYWPLGVFLIAPWFLLVGEASGPARPLGRAGWWLLQTVVVVASMLLSLQLVPGIYVISLWLPLFPLILGLHAFAAGRQREKWAFALSGAAFVSWMLMAVLPLI